MHTLDGPPSFRNDNDLILRSFVGYYCCARKGGARSPGLELTPLTLLCEIVRATDIPAAPTRGGIERRRRSSGSAPTPDAHGADADMG